MTESTVAFMFFVIVASGVFIIAMSLRNRQRLRELAMRERIAMIEKGLVPPPEVDPARFDRFDRLERLMVFQRRLNQSGQRYRSLGIMTIGFGLAFLVMLTFAAGVPGVGLGVGGALMILGAAMFVNGMIQAHTAVPDEPLPYTPSQAPTEPPGNVAP